MDVEVDVTTVDPVNAFLSSDEEGENPDTLLYLPVSPDIDPEDEQQAEAQQVRVRLRRSCVVPCLVHATLHVHMYMYKSFMKRLFFASLTRLMLLLSFIKIDK